MDDKASLYNRVSNDRISARQMDELIGLARGLCADGVLNEAEVEFLQKWLAASLAVNDQPLMQTLWNRIDGVLADGALDENEHSDLLEFLKAVGPTDVELGEVLKSTSLPIDSPQPELEFAGRQFSFTGTFSYGQRKDCEKAVQERGAICGGLTMKTDFLVVGIYATESWKHSSMGTKILKACDYKSHGAPIAIVTEEHWRRFL